MVRKTWTWTVADDTVVETGAVYGTVGDTVCIRCCKFESTVIWALCTVL